MAGAGPKKALSNLLAQRVLRRATEIAAPSATRIPGSGHASTAQQLRQPPSAPASESLELRGIRAPPAGQDELERIKTDVFRLPGPFRPSQREAIQAGLAGRNLLLVMGTGGGKTLTYMLPAYLRSQPGVTVVVSPLLALIADQYRYCQSVAGLASFAFHGAVARPRQFAALRRLESHHIVFVTPERLVIKSDFMDALAEMSCPPQRIVFDEAHCIVNWGETFRPTYLAAAELLRGSFPDVPWTMVTATAPPAVKSALLDLFPKQKHPVTVIQPRSTNRANLQYELRPKPRDKHEVLKLVKDLCDNGAAALVYVMTKDDADEVNEGLRALGVNSSAFHSGLADSARAREQSRWLSGEVDVLVATPAFGMGVHHPSVRTVVHHSLPLSLSDYAQASGRAGAAAASGNGLTSTAGRDGLAAKCVVLFSGKDYNRAAWLVGTSGKEGLLEVLSMCVRKTCVRLAIATHMGEVAPGTDKCVDANCVVCAAKSSPGVKTAATRQAAPPAAWQAAPPAAWQAAPPAAWQAATAEADVEPQQQGRHAPLIDDAHDQDDTADASLVLRARCQRRAKQLGLSARHVPSRAAIRRAIKANASSVQELELVPGFGPERAQQWFRVLFE